MTEQYEKLQRCVRLIRQKTDFMPHTAVVLGSGLGQYAEQMDTVCEIPYSDLPDFPVSTVAGHDGRFLFGHIAGQPVVLMKGRVHYYEGYDMDEVVMPVRIMGLLGVKTILLTNAAGGINKDFRPGDLMLIEDHISFGVPSPLRGPNIDELGLRFPDMSNVYDLDVQQVIVESAQRLGISLQQGTYFQSSGPNYETPAEIRMLRALGADAVGMSTACEAMAANHMQLRVGGISCITNMAAGILPQPLDHEEVQRTALQVQDKFERLVSEIIRSL